MTRISSKPSEGSFLNVWNHSFTGYSQCILGTWGEEGIVLRFADCDNETSVELLARVFGN